jgi:protein-disulfide isomerase
MKTFQIFFILAILAISVFAQKPDEILAKANNRNFTTADLSPEAQKLRQNLPVTIAQARSQIFSQTVADVLFEAEAKATNTTAEKLIEAAMSKIPAPTSAKILAVYEANREVFADKTLEQAKPQIVSFLRTEPEQKALQILVDGLRTKYKVVFGKDVNAADLKSLDALVTINGKTISAQEFDEKNKFALYEIRANVFENIKDDLKSVIASELLNTEAKELQIDAGDIRAREVTDKMRDYSNEEREMLETALEKRLFAKYKVQFLMKEPEPMVQSISTDDDPSQGKANAPVTVVMFSDFQCPACGATHPILKKVVAEYGDKIRFVVRDFPLTNIHENAFPAALAAKAAFNQGKFFEYSDKLYSNQNALDGVSLKKYATELGLNLKQFEIDLTDEKTASEVRKDISDGETYGIKGTPTIFINGVRVRRLSAEGFREAIEKALGK